jgi:hypothetical protein
MRKLFAVWMCLVSFSSASIFNSRLIDLNGAQTLQRGDYSVTTRISPPGATSAQGAGVILSVDVGLSDRLTIGVGYGGDGVIGRDGVDWYPWPGARLRYHLFKAPRRRWSVVTGIDIQGFGGIAPEYRGFAYKSQGFFVSAGRPYPFFSFPAGFTVMVNYSLEDLDTVHWPNFAIATDINLNNELAAIVEYDFAVNQQIRDKEPDRYWGVTSGFLNLGMKWRFVSSLQLSVNFRDVLNNRIRSKNYPDEDDVFGWGREIKLEYFARF